jgi:2-dehydropantoate 2-reductase
MANSPTPILIIGTGALASLFAARLTAAGQTVQMLGSWQTATDAINRDGLHLLEGDEETSYSVSATANPAGCAGARYALVLVKSWQTQRAADQLAECLAEDGIALSLQNGMGNREILSQVLGADRVALGSTTTGASLVAPGRVRAGGEGVISLSTHPQLKVLAEHLSSAAFSVHFEEDIDSLIWSKLVINAAINPLTALLGIPNGQLLANPAARQLSAQLAKEVAAVATAQGVKLNFDDPVLAAEDVARRTAANQSSMWQDVQRGAPTEIEAICGAIIRAGQKKRIPTPVNQTMRQLILALVHSKSETEKETGAA